MEECHSSAVRVILFDVYGTLVKIQDKRSPFRQPIQIGARQGRTPSARDAEILMGRPVGLLDVDMPAGSCAARPARC
jgi:hypothetical protein